MALFLPIKPVHCAGYAAFGDSSIDNLDKIVTDWSCLAQYGVSLASAQTNLRAFRDLPDVWMFHDPSKADLDIVVAGLLESSFAGATASSRWSKVVSMKCGISAGSSNSSSSASVFIAQDDDNWEAVFTARIIASSRPFSRMMRRRRRTCSATRWRWRMIFCLAL